MHCRTPTAVPCRRRAACGAQRNPGGSARCEAGTDLAKARRMNAAYRVVSRRIVVGLLFHLRWWPRRRVAAPRRAAAMREQAGAPAGPVAAAEAAEPARGAAAAGAALVRAPAAGVVPAAGAAPAAGAVRARAAEARAARAPAGVAAARAAVAAARAAPARGRPAAPGRWSRVARPAAVMRRRQRAVMHDPVRVHAGPPHVHDRNRLPSGAAVLRNALARRRPARPAATPPCAPCSCRYAAQGSECTGGKCNTQDPDGYGVCRWRMATRSQSRGRPSMPDVVRRGRRKRGAAISNLEQLPQDGRISAKYHRRMASVGSGESTRRVGKSAVEIDERTFVLGRGIFSDVCQRTMNLYPSVMNLYPSVMIVYPRTLASFAKRLCVLAVCHGSFGGRRFFLGRKVLRSSSRASLMERRSAFLSEEDLGCESKDLFLRAKHHRFLVQGALLLGEGGAIFFLTKASLLLVEGPWSGDQDAFGLVQGTRQSSKAHLVWAMGVLIDQGRSARRRETLRRAGAGLVDDRDPSGASFAALTLT